MSMMPFMLWKAENPSPLRLPLMFHDHTHVRDLKELEVYFVKQYFRGEEMYLFSSNPASLWHPGMASEKLSPDYIMRLASSPFVSNVDAFTLSLLASNRNVYRFNALANPFDQDEDYINSFEFAEYWLGCRHESLPAIEWVDRFMRISMSDTSVYELIAPKTEAEERALLNRLGFA